MRVVCLILSFVLLTPAYADRGDRPDPAAIPDAVSRALHDPARGADAEDDARRKPGAVLAFSGVAPGDRVLEIIPGSGYWTRLFSPIVGDDGQVYELIPNAVAKAHPDSVQTLSAIAGSRHYANVSLLRQPADALAVPEPVDVVFTAENLHDYDNAGMGHITPKALAAMVFDALRPGGVFLVNDHVALAGSGLSATDTLHRIDPRLVKRQVTAAGFVFDGASRALRNRADPRDVKVFDPEIRGHTDQFIYRFRKPGNANDGD